MRRCPRALPASATIAASRWSRRWTSRRRISMSRAVSPRRLRCAEFDAAPKCGMQTLAPIRPHWAANLMSDDTSPKWTDEDTEALFTTLGKYWVIFQWVESLLDRLLLLAWGHENWAASQDRLARMSNVQKIDCVESIVLTTPDFARVHTRPEWVSHFRSVIEALQSERK